jgi:hypothetical protein
MNKNQFLSLMGKGRLSKDKIIKRLQEGDIYPTDIKGNSKYFVDMNMAAMMTTNYNKKKFLKWWVKMSTNQKGSNCTPSILKALEDNDITIFDTEIMEVLPEDCVKRLASMAKNKTSYVPELITQVSNYRQKTDKDLLDYIVNLEKKEKSQYGNVLDAFVQMNISNKRSVPRSDGKIMKSLKRSIKVKKLDVDKQDFIGKKYMPKEPSNYKIYKMMNKEKISDESVKKFFDRVISTVPLKNNSSASETSSTRSSIASNTPSRRSSVASKSSSRRSRSSKGSKTSSTSREMDNYQKQRKPKIKNLSLIKIPRKVVIEKKPTKLDVDGSEDEVRRRIPFFGTDKITAYSTGRLSKKKVSKRR